MRRLGIPSWGQHCLRLDLCCFLDCNANLRRVVSEKDERNYLVNHYWILAVLVTLGMFTTDASACSVCMGDVNSNLAGATNAAIFVMLGAIGAMLGSSIGFGLYIYKRSQNPLPPHLELMQELGQVNDIH